MRRNWKGKAWQPFSSPRSRSPRQNIWCKFECIYTIDWALMWRVCEVTRACVCVCVCVCVNGYCMFGACFWRFPETRGGEQRVDERRLTAKQSISPSHRPLHTSQTHPSLLTQWRVSFIKQGLARASHVCVGARRGVCVRVCTRICARIQAHACDSACRAALPSASEVHSPGGRRKGVRDEEWEGERERESGRKRGITGVEWVSECVRSRGSERKKKQKKKRLD